MQSLNQPEAVKKQYQTADKLNIRISLHHKYSTNHQGFGNWILSHYRLEPGMAVLELGCGTGEMWVNHTDVIRPCSRFILSDISAGMLEKAKETLGDSSGIEYRMIDISRIPFPKETFDAVIANMMLYHVPDLQKGLEEVRRVLKQGGAFYCATYGENGMMAHIASMFKKYQAEHRVNTNFTLQNGEQILRAVFGSVERLIYQDALAVTNVEDLADYIGSLTAMSELQKLPRSTIMAVLEQNIINGVLTIPKEYGMFIAR